MDFYLPGDSFEITALPSVPGADWCRHSCSKPCNHHFTYLHIYHIFFENRACNKHTEIYRDTAHKRYKRIPKKHLIHLPPMVCTQTGQIVVLILTTEGAYKSIMFDIDMNIMYKNIYLRF